MDITISKKATINTGNYSSITPSVSLTLSDVDIRVIKEIHSDLNVLATALFLEEFFTMSGLQDEVKKLGIREFFNQLDMEEMKEEFYDSLGKLKHNLTKI
jgi:hypothetical protein